MDGKKESPILSLQGVASALGIPWGRFQWRLRNGGYPDISGFLVPVEGAGIRQRFYRREVVEFLRAIPIRPVGNHSGKPRTGKARQK